MVPIEKCVDQVISGMTWVGTAPSDVWVSDSPRNHWFLIRREAYLSCSWGAGSSAISQDCQWGRSQWFDIWSNWFPYFLLYIRPSREMNSHLLCTQHTVRLALALERLAHGTRHTSQAKSFWPNTKLCGIDYRLFGEQSIWSGLWIYVGAPHSQAPQGEWCEAKLALVVHTSSILGWKRHLLCFLFLPQALSGTKVIRLMSPAVTMIGFVFVPW